ncbi:hypothetical protein ACXR0O_08865 [Verrucomicrobiota bacterium sgz303538]
MRLLFFVPLLVTLVSSLSAGEIVVYNQKWTGTAVQGLKEKVGGKGYILLDLENRKFTRISTGFAPLSSYQKIYRVETYSPAIFSEPSNSGSIFLAVQGTATRSETWSSWQRTVFLKGKETLLSIGPSQKKQVPKVLTGVRRMAQSDSITNRIEEDSFSATFNASMTMDANGNSRTLEQQVELLTSSLEEAGYSSWGS